MKYCLVVAIAFLALAVQLQVSSADFEADSRWEKYKVRNL